MDEMEKLEKKVGLERRETLDPQESRDQVVRREWKVTKDSLELWLALQCNNVL